MTESKRKQAQRKKSRAEGRSGVLRRRKPDGEAPKQAQGKLDPQSSDAKKGAADPQLDDSSKVSSLLETSGKEVKQLLEAADDAAEKIREAAKTNALAGRDDESGTASDAMSSMADATTCRPRGPYSFCSRARISDVNWQCWQ